MGKSIVLEHLFFWQLVAVAKHHLLLPISESKSALIHWDVKFRPVLSP